MSSVFCSLTEPWACIHFQRMCSEANFSRYSCYPASRAAATVARTHHRWWCTPRSDVRLRRWPIDGPTPANPFFLNLASSEALRFRTECVLLKYHAIEKLSWCLRHVCRAPSLVNDIHRNMYHLRVDVWLSPPAFFLYKCNQTDQTVDVTSKSTFPGASAL